MKGYVKWPIDAPLLVLAAYMLVALLLAGCQVTLHGVDGRAVGQVTVDPDGVQPGVKSGSLSSNEMPLR